MKYIRTADGIYEVTNNKFGIIEEDGKFKKFCENMGHTWYGELEVIAQADTIEELCDEYVLPKFREVFAIDRFSKHICINHIKCGNGDVYGAIWTSKGLIYVAKLNEKGELELI